MPQYFTVDQANDLITVVRPWIAEILKIRRRVIARRPEIWPVLAKAAGNGGSKTATQVDQEFQRLDSLERQVQETGAMIKDLNIGLVDFLARREGRLIYLCWQYGEETIQYWHELDAGMTGRQPI